MTKRKTMSKQTDKRTKGAPGPKPATTRADKAYPVEQEDLDEQQERLRKAAVAGADALERRAPAATPKLLPSPEKVAAKPLTPLAALWLKSDAPKAAAAKAAPRPPPPPVRHVPPKPAEQAAAAAPAAWPTVPKTRNVVFVLPEPNAKRVSLSGEFNGWSPNATPMKRQQDGRWEATVDLAPGRYQYKFVVDGQWIPDPHAHENVWNQHGTLNSVVEVRA